MTVVEEQSFVLLKSGSTTVFRCGEKLLRLSFPNASCVRVTYTEGRPFQDKPSRIVVAQGPGVEPKVSEDAESFSIATGALTVVLQKATGALSYWNGAGKLLTREPPRGGRWMTPKKLYRNIFAKGCENAATLGVDGVRATAAPYETVFDRMAFEAKLEFCFSDDEALFGLGSHEEGYGNLRGRSRELYQQNMKAVVPCFASTRGYAVLLDCCSLMTFRDDEHGSCWSADAVEELDFYVIAGANFEEVMRGYRLLTGAIPLPPRWIFGYVQSKERYVNAEEILAVVREYRRRGIPLDTIVLDWKSWPNGAGWGQKSFDPQRFSDPEAMIAKLHGMGVHLMMSIWPIMTGGCADQVEMLDRGGMLGDQATYDAFSAEARATYWEQAERGLFSKGVDAWWCDCTEPFEADWNGAVKPEPHARLTMNTEVLKRYLDATESNAYSLLHAQGIYEGQRAETDGKRVVNLTRSSYAGQSRYGTITWNGDVSATWETLRRSIAEGIHFCASGEPYWTVDIGGFFIANDPKFWFWSGDYAEGCRGLTNIDALEPDPQDTGCRDLGYWELYTRWLQYGAFLPIFRSHGTDAAREIWRFGEPGTPFYDAIARFIRLRYELLPYIYSLAAEVTLRASPMLRAVALEFPEDRAAHELADQFFFGPALLVCPVIRPMYYEAGSRPLDETSKTRRVYLPKGCRWFDFWTGAAYDGEQEIPAHAPLEIVPLFVRAGSILPMTEAMQFVDERRDAPYEIRVYSGRDAAFTIYEDEGDSYGYEHGACARVRLRWNEAARQLTLGEREGEYPGMAGEREYRIVVFSGTGQQRRSVRYTGQEIQVEV